MMKRLLKTALLGTLGMVALGASGCVVVNDGYLADYEECDYDSDCDSGRCANVTGRWSDGTVVYTSFCTVGCIDEFDCLDTASGLEGTCASVDGSPYLCRESCIDDFDCASGWACDGLICLPY